MTIDTLKPEELRIGNWLIHNSEWSHRNDVRPLRKPFPFQWDDSDWYALGESTLMFEQISPIPLTPEILEKCGFEKHNPSCYIKKYSNQGELTLFSSDTPVGIANNFESNSFYYGFNHIDHIIKYLHQLQNLYYALTQTELQIQL